MDGPILSRFGPHIKMEDATHTHTHHKKHMNEFITLGGCMGRAGQVS